jgi:hypothetical protein
MSTISGLDFLSVSYFQQSVQGTSSTGSDSSPTTSSAVGGPGATSSISGPGQLLSELQLLQAQDPSKFKDVVSQIANELQTAAQQQGSSGAGQFLSNLAARFQNVANTGDLSQLQPHHGHHGHHGHHSYDRQGQPVPASSSSTDSSDPLQQLFANITQQVQQALAS